MVRWTAPGLAWQAWDAPWEATEPIADTPANRASFEERRRRRTAPGKVRTRLEIDIRPGAQPGQTAAPRHLGWVSRYWVGEETGWLEVGIDICEEDAWGRGFGREALELWIDYLFRELPLRRVGLTTWSGNARMAALAKRLGLVLEARIRQARVVRGEVYDALKYGVLREEWQARTPRFSCQTGGSV